MVFTTMLDLRNIKDSMQLDSDQEIARMEKDGYTATLEVRGEVKVWWNEDGEPCDGEYYTHPSEFPEKLSCLIADGHTADGSHWTFDPRLYISENNWFELFVTNPLYDTVPDADVVDSEGLSDHDVFSMLYEAIEERAKEDCV